MRLRLVDGRDRPVRNTLFGIKVATAGDTDAVLERRERSDGEGIIHLSLPAVAYEVELERAMATRKRHDVLVDDLSVTASYALKDVDPGAQADHAVKCAINR